MSFGVNWRESLSCMRPTLVHPGRYALIRTVHIFISTVHDGMTPRYATVVSNEEPAT